MTGSAKPSSPRSATPETAARPSWLVRLGRRVQPARRTRRGAAWATTVLLLVSAAILSADFRFGEGRTVDLGFGVAFALVGLALLPLVLGTLVRIVDACVGALGWLGVGALVMLFVVLDEAGLPQGFAAQLAAAAGLSAAAIGGSLAALTSPGFGDASLVRKLTTTVAGLGGIAGAVALGVWMTHPGDAEHVAPGDVRTAQPADGDTSTPPAVLAIADPSTPGEHAVATAFYGSGSDRHRPEFGESVPAALRTEPVNGRPFAEFRKGFRGWSKALRKRFWGFGVDALPLNGRVWHPDAPGPFPLVLIVHGNHNMAEFSDPGYAYLGELFASRGIVCVSVDENFLNSGSFMGMRGENDGRAWILLEHLRQWRTWNGTPGHPFEGKVDLDRVGLIGHSRGGEAVCHAALFNRLSHWPDDASVRFDYGFGIRAVASIAPVDRQYEPASRPTAMRDVNYFTIHGGHDADVSRFFGDRLFRRLEFTAAEPQGLFKASLHVHRANHGQFNEVWGAEDVGTPNSWFLNRGALLSGEDQRRIGKVFLSAFLATTLQDERGYLPLFREPRVGRDWLPDAALAARYEDDGFRVLADFGEDFDVTTTTVAGGSTSSNGLVVWREDDLSLRGGTDRDAAAVYLGWNAEPADEPSDDDVVAVEASTPPPPASYTISLPGDLATSWRLGRDSVLVLDLAQIKEKPEANDYDSDDDENENENEEGDQDAGDDGANAEPSNGPQTSPNAPTDDAAQNPATNGDGDEAAEDDDAPDFGPDPVDFTIELVDEDGDAAALPLSRFAALLRPLKARIMRPDALDSRYKSYEPTVQTVALPLAAFVDLGTGVHPERLASIRFVFDRTPKGVVAIDRVGFSAR